MLSFSQFLKEAGDAALPYSHTVDSYYGDHVYGFKHKGVHYRVNIGHNARNGADVSFYADHSKAHGDIGITGTAGTSSTKILSTIHHIIKKHVEQHPHVDEVTFSSVNAEPTRVKLYSKYTEKLGGQNHRRSYDTDHIIPASSYRTQISESGETPLPFRFDGEHDEYDQRYHRYSFQHNGKPFRVNIAHHDAPFPTAFVNFADYSKRPDLGDMNVTGRARHGAVKVLSTVHNIVKHHIGKHPEIEEVRFTSAPDEPSREKLYMRYAEKHGGISDPTGYDTIHVLPAKAYHVNESEEPIRIRLGKGPTGERAKQFMDDFHKDSDEHPFHHTARILHGATVHLSRDGNDVHMHDILTLAPKSGAGTKALKHLTGLADKHGVKINIFAKAYSNRPEHIKSTKRLVKWYEKHGFKHDEPDYDVDYGSEMTYYPK